MTLQEHLKNITRQELHEAVQVVNEEFGSPETAVEKLLIKAGEYAILDEIIKLIQDIGKQEQIGSPPMARAEGMKIIIEALIIIAERKAQSQ